MHAFVSDLLTVERPDPGVLLVILVALLVLLVVMLRDSRRR